MGDFAHQMRWLADEAYTKAEKIRVVPTESRVWELVAVYLSQSPLELYSLALSRLGMRLSMERGQLVTVLRLSITSTILGSLSG